ncbi:RNA-binding protein 1 [Hibiscus syriacus]|uniref:RNA-binding protein 1 n=1 Tax=Hibiscus syriacus TaxID=106335 RepID=A0A6A2XCI5_HIBSY|nr:RNA-binding protein 1-like [Hibiscus syriacus]KAE8656119.1 RNA-binding protein 1 [Hibiscus syriacus]
MESDKGKLFVGGISRETSEAILMDHFGKYGTVLSSVVAKDRNTKSPRGFAFVMFSESSSADKALQDTHVILGRTVEVKKAIPRSDQLQNQQQNGGFCMNGNGNDAADSNFRTKKLFVGGLSATLTEEEFRNYFQRFGRITDVVVMHDSLTNRPRGFGFVTFDSEESVENVMQKNFHELNNRLVEVKRAVPKEGSNGSYSNQNMKPGAVRGSPYNGFQAVEFTSNGSGYGMFPGYAPPPACNPVGDYLYGTATGVYGSGYPMVGYSRVAYGVTQATPRGPLYAPVMLGPRVYPLPYGSPSVYPAYMNSGVGLMGAAAGGFNGFMKTGVDGKWKGDNVDQPAHDIQPQTEAINGGTDCSGLKEHSVGAAAEQDPKSVDGKLKPSRIEVSR